MFGPYRYNSIKTHHDTSTCTRCAPIIRGMHFHHGLNMQNISIKIIIESKKRFCAESQMQIRPLISAQPEKSRSIYTRIIATNNIIYFLIGFSWNICIQRWVDCQIARHDGECNRNVKKRLNWWIAICIWQMLSRGKWFDQLMIDDDIRNVSS